MGSLAGREEKEEVEASSQAAKRRRNGVVGTHS